MMFYSKKINYEIFFSKIQLNFGTKKTKFRKIKNEQIEKAFHIVWQMV
jgi:hypothetical protein